MFGFNPEVYRGYTVDIIHPDSLQRTANGKKTKDIEGIAHAGLVLKRIAMLEKAGVDVRSIRDRLVFIPPDSRLPVVVGGAFDGECIAEYIKSAQKIGYSLRADPLLTLRSR